MTIGGNNLALADFRVRGKRGLRPQAVFQRANDIGLGIQPPHRVELELRFAARCSNTPAMPAKKHTVAKIPQSGFAAGGSDQRVFAEVDSGQANTIEGAAGAVDQPLGSG